MPRDGKDRRNRRREGDSNSDGVCDGDGGGVVGNGLGVIDSDGSGYDASDGVNAGERVMATAMATGTATATAMVRRRRRRWRRRRG